MNTRTLLKAWKRERALTEKALAELSPSGTGYLYENKADHFIDWLRNQPEYPGMSQEDFWRLYKRAMEWKR